jgi:hypothetical protein
VFLRFFETNVSFLNDWKCEVKFVWSLFPDEFRF